MDRVARLPAQERSELFSETATQKGTTPAVVEKDFWVTWVLNRLFREPDLARLLMFKGGTSLSKVYNLIERFSEDVDLVLDWRVLGGDDPLAERSKTKQAQLNAAVNERAQKYISGELLKLVEAALDGVCGCHMEVDDPYVIDINYPRPFLVITSVPKCAWKSVHWRHGCLMKIAVSAVMQQRPFPKCSSNE